MTKAQKKNDLILGDSAASGRPVRLNDLSPEAKRWRAENAEAAKAWTEWVEKNGGPLEDYRMF